LCSGSMRMTGFAGAGNGGNNAGAARLKNGAGVSGTAAAGRRVEGCAASFFCCAIGMFNSAKCACALVNRMQNVWWVGFRSDNCIVEKLRQFIDELKSHTASRDEKTDALRFVVHFVADIHQPLHCANRNDRGGNDVPLVWEGRRTNLHEIWDHYAVNLASIPDVTAGGNVVDWCNESHELARKSVYEGLPNNDAPLPQTYMDAATTITKGQLARAASRLATVLNESMR